MKQIIKAALQILIFVSLNITIYAGDPWADYYGTSSTAGTWDSGIRSDTTTTIQPPYVKRWERYAWSVTPGANVVPFTNSTLIYNGYVYFGQGDSDTGLLHWNDPGYIWAWDIQTGVTKTGFPLGPTNGGIISLGLAIANNKIYALSANEVYGWDLNTLNLISGFPINITETTDGGTNVVLPETGIIYYNNKLYFCTSQNMMYPNAPYYLYVKDANNGTEVFRKQIPSWGGTLPCIWNGRVYVADSGSGQIYCWDANTGAVCANFPVTITAGIRASPVIENGTIYIGTESGYFYSIDATTGNINWSYATVGSEHIDSTASIWQDKVYFGGENGNLYGLYKATGNLVSGFPVSNAGGSGPMSTANGVIYNAGYGGLAINANNGALLWTGNPDATHGGGVSFQYNYQSTTIGQNEIVTVYPAYNGIVVYCMPSPTASPTTSPTITGTPPTNTPSATDSTTLTVTPTVSATCTITPSSTFNVQSSTSTATVTSTSSVSDTPTMTPTKTEIPASFYFKLIANSPNPAKDYTYIIYELGMEAEVKVTIYTISGEKVTAFEQQGSQGRNSIRWNCKNFVNKDVASGVYIYRIEAVSGSNKAKAWSKLAVVR